MCHHPLLLSPSLQARLEQLMRCMDSHKASLHLHRLASSWQFRPRQVVSHSWCPLAMRVRVGLHQGCS
jgi:hypothetical protein